MGATLRYAKVIDADRFTAQGSQLRPGLDSEVRLSGEPPAVARPFLIVRSWEREDGFTETWRIADPHGRTLREGLARTVMDSDDDIADEVRDLEFEYADTGYQLILEVDGREVARVDFPVLEPSPAEQGHMTET
ncbi:MAG TPA: hypothetical protein VNU01_10400 [Egibacteraceae bacterium]|nr:hypothetical protein [Egibacteraceae bacterium]